MKGSLQSQKRNIFSDEVNYRPEILKKLREDMHLTQEQVADSIHMCEATVSNIELGNIKSPHFNHLFWMSVLYNVPICHITKGQVKKHHIKQLVESRLNIAVDKFFAVMRSNEQTDVKRRRLVKFALLSDGSLIEDLFKVIEQIVFSYKDCGPMS